MKIQKISIEGFRSIQTMDFEFDQTGITFIQAPNGTGKSTLFEALFFGLYGAPVKNSNLSSLATLKQYRPKGYKGTKIEVHFIQNGKNYRIVRTLSYGDSKSSNLDVYENDVHLQTKDKADAQSQLERIIGIPSELFLQTVFFAQKSVRIVDKKDAERRDVLEVLFDVNVEQYAEKAKKSFETKSAAVADKQRELHSTSIGLTQLKDQAEQYQAIINNFETDRKVNADKFAAQLSQKITELANLPAVVEIIQTEFDRSKLNSLESQVGNVSNTITTAQRELERLSRPVQDTCNSCLQPLPSDKIEAVKAKQTEDIDQITKVIGENTIVYHRLQAELEVERQAYRDFEAARLTTSAQVVANNAIINKQTALNAEIEGIKNTLHHINTQVCPVTEQQLVDNQTKQRQLIDDNSRLTAEIETLTSELEDYRYWATSGFGDKGIKAYLFQVMMGDLNRALRIYGDQLGLLVEFALKLDTKSKSFDIKIKTLDGVEKNYGDLSGGEQKRVDVIVSFALHDLLSLKVSAPSVLVLDEIFEGLDEEGLDVAISLIKKKSEASGVYIITHHVNVDITQSKIIRLKKVNFLTEIDN